MTTSGQDVYRERAHLLALLAALYPSHMREDPDWPVLFVSLPTGQATWHISRMDMDLFGHVRTDVAEVWDGHTTQEKYDRVDQAARDAAAGLLAD